MNDFKNLLLAWASSSTSVAAAIEAKTMITIVSAIILPILFFTIGKTVDVMLQIHFKKRSLRERTSNRSSVPVPQHDEEEKK